MTDIFDDLQDGRRLTIKRADGGLLLTIATMHRMETVPLTEERADDLARWLEAFDDSGRRELLDRAVAAELERDEWKALAHSTEETLKLQQGASTDQFAEANRTGQAMGAAAERESIAAWLEVLDADGGIAEASEMQPHLHGRVRNGAHRPALIDALVAKARTVEPRATEPPRREAVEVEHADELREATAAVERISYDPECVPVFSDENRVCNAASVRILVKRLVEGTLAPEPRTRADRDLLQAVAHRLSGALGGSRSDEDLRAAVLDIENRMYLAGTPAPEPSLPEGARLLEGQVHWERGDRTWMFYAEDDGITCCVEGARPVHKTGGWMACANAAIAKRGTPGSTEL